MHTLDVTVAIGPCTEFFHEPRGQSRRRIRQPISERLWLRALDLLITDFHFGPSRQIVEVDPFLRRWLCWHRQITPHHQKIQMDAHQRARMRDAETSGSERAVIAALGSEPFESQNIFHQVVQAVGDLLDAETRLTRSERQTKAGQRRRDDRKGVAWVTAE